MKRPALYIAVFFCLGIILSRHLHIPIAYPWVISAVFIILALIVNKNDKFSHTALYAAVLFFGITWYQNSLILPADHISHHLQNEPQKILIRGVVADDPVTSPALYGKKKISFVIRAEGLGLLRPLGARNDESSGTVPIFQWQSASGLVLVSAYSDKAIPVAFCDELVLEGYLASVPSLKNPGVFDYSEYLAVRNIYSVLRVTETSVVKKFGAKSFLTRTGQVGSVHCPGQESAVNRLKKTAYSIRHFIRDALDKYLDEPYRGFTKAILIGDRSSLSKNLREDFVKTGTVHISAWQYTSIVSPKF